MAITSRPGRNWGRIALVSALILSLAGNAVAFGAAMRLRALRHDLFGPAGQTAVFPPATREALRSAFGANRNTLLPQVQALAALRSKIVADAATRPFDRAATEADMTALRQAADRLLLQAQGIVLNTLEAQAQK